MSTEYGVNLVNPEFFETLISDSETAFLCRAIGCRTLTFKVSPRIGESIMYPLLTCLDDGVKYQLRNRIVLEVIDIIHNPESVMNDCVKSEKEFDVVLVLKVKLIKRI